MCFNFAIRYPLGGLCLLMGLLATPRHRHELAPVPFQHAKVGLVEPETRLLLGPAEPDPPIEGQIFGGEY